MSNDNTDPLAGAPSAAMPFQPEPLDNLPDMTATEASFHTSTAGIRAAQAAAKNSDINGSAVDALAAHANGGTTLHGLRLSHPSAHSAYAVPATAKLFEATGIHPQGVDETGVFIYCFVDPKRAYALAKTQADAPAAEELLKAAESVILHLGTEEKIDAVRLWCMEAFLRLNGVGKSSAAEAARQMLGQESSPATAPETPTSNGSPNPAMAGTPAPVGSSPS